ncbi:hypothetical protein WICPIJ_010081 [Wickerhamomyces pijperi]|uniref:Uncharacterized protein n=1 Tax=Wickerhamomyces pijperi TaxID=599730 RepID=A0A9P8TB26_WICPI|nr:hypothetical protein WICPIJ_010081 [Wickerhamomyces pijperi]
MEVFEDSFNFSPAFNTTSKMAFNMAVLTPGVSAVLTPVTNSVTKGSTLGWYSIKAYKIAALMSLLNLSPMTLISGPVTRVTNGFKAVAGVLETTSAIAKAEDSLKSGVPYIKPCKKIGKMAFGPFGSVKPYKSSPATPVVDKACLEDLTNLSKVSLDCCLTKAVKAVMAFLTTFGSLSSMA